MKSLIFFVISYFLIAIDSIYFAYELFLRFNENGREPYWLFLKYYFLQTLGGPLTLAWIVFGVIGYLLLSMEKKKAANSTKKKAAELIEEFKKENRLR